MKTKIMLQGLEETVTRPIQIIVANDIKKLLGLGRDIYIAFDPTDERIAKIKNQLGDIDHDNTTFEEYILLETEESTEEGTELYMTTVKPDTYPIYQDIEIDSYIQAINQRRQLDFTFTYRNKSKSLVHSLANKLKLMTGDDGMYYRHELEYGYNIPPFVIKLLSHFNDLKNKRKRPDRQLSFSDYLARTFDTRLDLGGNLGKTIDNYTLYIREAQVNLEGYISDSVHDIKPEFDDNLNHWGITFRYRITFDKPVGLLLNYNMMVWNTPIAKEFRDFQHIENTSNRAIHPRSLRGVNLTTIGHPIWHTRPRKDYLTIPIEDNRLPNLITPRYLTRMFSVLTMVDSNDPTLLFNIDEIPNYRFKKSVYDMLLKSEYKWVGIPCCSVIFISLICGEVEQYENRIIMDAEGNLRTTKPMDVTKTYRVMFSLLNDLDMLNPGSTRRINRFIDDEMDAYREKYKNLRKNNDSLYTQAKEIYNDEVFLDIYAEILQVDHRDVLNNVNPDPNKNADLLKNMIYRISDHYRHMAKTVNVFNVHAACLEPSNSPH